MNSGPGTAGQEAAAWTSMHPRRRSRRGSLLLLVMLLLMLPRLPKLLLLLLLVLQQQLCCQAAAAACGAAPRRAASCGAGIGVLELKVHAIGCVSPQWGGAPRALLQLLAGRSSSLSRHRCVRLRSVDDGDTSARESFLLLQVGSSRQSGACTAPWQLPIAIRILSGRMIAQEALRRGTSGSVQRLDSTPSLGPHARPCCNQGGHRCCRGLGIRVGRCRHVQRLASIVVLGPHVCTRRHERRHRRCCCLGVSVAHRHVQRGPSLAVPGVDIRPSLQGCLDSCQAAIAVWLTDRQEEGDLRTRAGRQPLKQVHEARQGLSRGTCTTPRPLPAALQPWPCVWAPPVSF